MTARRSLASSPSLEPSGKPAAAQPAATGEWLVADIGGTNSRFVQWTENEGLARGSRRAYRNDDFPDLAAVIRTYRRDIGSEALQALLAIASPIGPRISLPMTNRDWSLDVHALRADTGLARLCLVNDLAAAAAGIQALGASEIEATQGSRDETAPKLLIGIGTGLGAAIVVTEETKVRILASEAGHMAAAVTGAVAQQALVLAAHLHGRVSWERLLSGEGLSCFDAAARGDDRPAPAAEVAARALAGEAQATIAVEAFADALGQFAGDLCLAAGAWGGVYFTGGVLTGLGEAFELGALRPGFDNKGRLTARVQSVPLFRVLVDNLAERGLDRLLAGAAEAPIVCEQL